MFSFFYLCPVEFCGVYFFSGVCVRERERQRERDHIYSCCVVSRVQVVIQLVHTPICSQNGVTVINNQKHTLLQASVETVLCCMCPLCCVCVCVVSALCVCRVYCV